MFTIRNFKVIKGVETSLIKNRFMWYRCTNINVIIFTVSIIIWNDTEVHPNNFIHPQQLSKAPNCHQSTILLSWLSFPGTDLRSPRDDILTLVSKVCCTYHI